MSVRVIVLLAAAVLVGIVLNRARANDCELGAFGCGHQQQHEQYQGWKDKTGNGCCSGQDCRPVRARLTFEGGWQIFVPEYRAWVDVPAKAVGEPDRFKDGRSHACTAEPLNWRRVDPFKPLPVYCLSPTGSKS